MALAGGGAASACVCSAIGIDSGRSGSPEQATSLFGMMRAHDDKGALFSPGIIPPSPFPAPALPFRFGWGLQDLRVLLIHSCVLVRVWGVERRSYTRRRLGCRYQRRVE